MREKYKNTAIKALNVGEYEKALHFLRLCAERGSDKTRLEYAYLLHCLGYDTDSAYISIFSSIIHKNSLSDAYIVLVSMLSDKDESLKYYFFNTDLSNIVERGSIKQDSLCQRIFDGEDIDGFRAVFENSEEDYEFNVDEIEADIEQGYPSGCESWKESNANVNYPDKNESASGQAKDCVKPGGTRNKAKDDKERQAEGFNFLTNQVFYNFNPQNDRPHSDEDLFFVKVSEFFYDLKDRQLKSVSLMSKEKLVKAFGNAPFVSRRYVVCEIGQMFETIIENGYQHSATIILKYLLSKEVYNLVEYFSELCEVCFFDSVVFKALRIKALGCVGSAEYATVRDGFIASCEDDDDIFETLLFIGDYQTIINHYNACKENYEDTCGRLYYYALALYETGLKDAAAKAFRDLIDMDCFNPFYKFMSLSIEYDETQKFDFSKKRAGIPVSEFVKKYKSFEELVCAVKNKRDYYLCEIAFGSGLFSQKIIGCMLKDEFFNDMIERMLLSPSIITENKLTVLRLQAKQGKKLVFSDCERLYQIENYVPSKLRTHCFEILRALILAGGTPEPDFMGKAAEVFLRIKKKYEGYKDIDKMETVLYCLSALCLEDLNMTRICYILGLDYKFIRSLYETSGSFE